MKFIIIKSNKSKIDIVIIRITIENNSTSEIKNFSFILNSLNELLN
jgi:hypothetical protein